VRASFLFGSIASTLTMHSAIPTMDSATQDHDRRDKRGSDDPASASSAAGGGGNDLAGAGAGTEGDKHGSNEQGVGVSGATGVGDTLFATPMESVHLTDFADEQFTLDAFDNGLAGITGLYVHSLYRSPSSSLLPFPVSSTNMRLLGVIELCVSIYPPPPPNTHTFPAQLLLARCCACPCLLNFYLLVVVHVRVFSSPPLSTINPVAGETKRSWNSQRWGSLTTMMVLIWTVLVVEWVTLVEAAVAAEVVAVVAVVVAAAVVVVVEAGGKGRTRRWCYHRGNRERPGVCSYRTQAVTAGRQQRVSMRLRSISLRLRSQHGIAVRRTTLGLCYCMFVLDDVMRSDALFWVEVMDVYAPIACIFSGGGVLRCTL
jgi:hypothetical protein